MKRAEKKSPPHNPAPAIRPWRPTRADAWQRGTVSLEDAADGYYDLLCRNRALLKALSIAGAAEDDPRLSRFRALDQELIGQLVLLRCDQVVPPALPEMLGRAQATVAKLAGLRRQILEQLPPAARNRALQAEPRIRARMDLLEHEVGAAIEAAPELLTPKLPRLDVTRAIEAVFPDGLIEMSFDFEETWLAEILPRLTSRLERIPFTALAWERGPTAQWDDVDDLDDEDLDDSVDQDDRSYSYHLFFLSPKSRRVKYQIESESADEEAGDLIVGGVGRFGYSVGVSLLAPFAVVTLSTLEQLEDGSVTIPDLNQKCWAMGGPKEDDLEAYGRRMLGDEAMVALRALRKKLIGVLEALDITILDEQDLSQPVPWLEVGEKVLAGPRAGSGVLTVRDAFFFSSL